MTDTNGISSSSNNNHHHHRQDLSLYFLELSRHGSSQGPCDMDEDEEAPTELNTINSSGGFLVVSPDKLSIKYTSIDLHGHDVGVIQANKPAPRKRLVYYFEIYVKDAGTKGHVAIGFTSKGFKMRRQPGNSASRKFKNMAPSSFQDSNENKMWLRQKDSVKEFNAFFDDATSNVQLPERYFVMTYVAGLKREIVESVRLFQLRTICDACSIARAEEISIQWRAKKAIKELEDQEKDLAAQEFDASCLFNNEERFVNQVVSVEAKLEEQETESHDEAKVM